MALVAVTCFGLSKTALPSSGALGEAWRRRPVRDRAAARADAAPEDVSDAGPDAAGGAADEHRGVRALLLTRLAGTVAGASTMVANAGGPPMTLYLLRMNVSVLGFMGTFTVFFFILNVLKVPLSLGLGLITAESLRLDLILLPAVLAGTLLGTFLLPRLRRDTFEWIAIVSTALASVWLIATA